MQTVAIILLLIAATAWLAPAIQALRKGRRQLGLLWLCSGPVAVALYKLDPHPNVATGAFMTLVIGGSLVWRLTRK